MPHNEEDLSVKIGQRLRGARTEQGLSLQELSDLTGGVLSKSRISNYERGIRRMGIEEAQILATALAIDPVYLLCLDDADFLPEKERALIEWYRQTDERGRAAIDLAAEVEAQRTPKR